MPRSRRTSGINHRLIAFVFLVVRHPRRTLALALLGVGVAAALAWFRLDVSTDQDQLFSTSVPFFRDYVGFTKAFPENQAGFAIIQERDAARPPTADRWMAVADAVAARLAADHENVHIVEGHVSVDAIGPQGLLFSDDPNEVQKRSKQVREQLIELAQRWGEKPGFGYGTLGPSPLQRFVAGVALAPADKLDVQLAQFFDLLARSWVKAIDDPHRPVTVGDQVPDLASLEASTPREKGYAYIPDPDNAGRHLLLVKFFEREKLTSKDGLVKVIAGIRADIAEAGKPFDREFTIGLSGRPALDADELETTDRDSRRAEIVSLSAVFLGLVLFLRSVWLAVVAELALLIGIAWTFGWATASTAAYNLAPRGDLNLLSMVFLIALIGIGMDYLIQILTRYRQEAVRHGPADTRRDAKSIWAGVFKHVAAPINTACLGAAGAFLVSVFTPFRGAAELGLIAGGGLLLCLATGYVVLPALLTIFPARIQATPSERDGAVSHVDVEPTDAAAPQQRKFNRWLILPIAWGVLLIAGIPFMRRTAFNPGLITLQAQNLESVQLIHKLPTWFEVELSKDVTVLRQVKRAVELLPTVDHTESVITALDNYDWLKANPLPDVHWVDPAAVADNDLPGIADRAAALAGRFATIGGDPFAKAAGSLRLFESRLRAATKAGGAVDDLAAQRLTLWQIAFVNELKGLLAPFYPSPPDVNALPETVRGHLLGLDGRYALYILPKKDCWPQANLAEFVTSVESAVSTLNKDGGQIPPVTGVAGDVFHSTDQTHAAFKDATCYALALIFLLVYLDLRDIRQTLLAISVLALGLPMLVAVMGLLHIDWNFANFFGLPILIGAGHEYGVFMVHRYNEACRDPHRPWRRWDVSDRALLLCGYVTSISFGFFWLFGHHLGLKSLGLVMALGIACIYLATLCVLRPLLLWRLARGGDGCAAPRTASREPVAVP